MGEEVGKVTWGVWPHRAALGCVQAAEPLFPPSPVLPESAGLCGGGCWWPAGGRGQQ